MFNKTKPITAKIDAITAQIITHVFFILLNIIFPFENVVNPNRGIYRQKHAFTKTASHNSVHHIDIRNIAGIQNK